MERKDASVEARGRNVEEAIANGLAQLKLARDQVEVEVISRGSRGVLGLGAEDARVLLKPVVSITTSEDAAEATHDISRQHPHETEYETESIEEVSDEGAAPAIEVATTEVDKIAVEALDGLLKRMSISAQVVVKPPSGSMVEGNNPPPLVLDIRGEDLGILIGRRGETLGAIQFLVRLMVNRQTREWVNVVIDVEGYKDRREKQLQQLAQRMAERVVSSQKSVVLEAMPPYERRIVHLALRDHPQVTTHSIGEDENRKVMIVLRQ